MLWLIHLAKYEGLDNANRWSTRKRSEVFLSLEQKPTNQLIILGFQPIENDIDQTVGVVTQYEIVNSGAK